MKIYRILLILLGIFSASLSGYYNHKETFFALILLPIVSTVVLYRLSLINYGFRPGFFLINIVIFIRYIVFIPLFILSDYSNFLSPVYSSGASEISFAIFLCLFELLIITVFICYILPKINVKTSLFVERVDLPRIFVLPLILLSCLILANNVDLLNNYSFALSEYNFEEKPKNLGGFEDSFIAWAKLLITIWFFKYFYRLYLKGQAKVYYLISFLLPLILSSFYTSSSRISMLLPLLSLILVYRKIIGRKANRIIFPAFIFLAISFFYISSNKSINETQLSKETQLAISSDLVNMYFAGFPNVLNGVKIAKIDDDDIKFEWLINDLFSGVNGVAKNFENSISLNRRYGDFLYGNGFGYGYYDQILPTVVMGYYYFGVLLSPIFTVIMLFFIYYLDSMFVCSKNIYVMFFTAYFSLLFGYAFVGSFMHLFVSITNTIIPLLIIFLISNLYKLKF